MKSYKKLFNENTVINKNIDFDIKSLIILNEYNNYCHYTEDGVFFFKVVINIEPEKIEIKDILLKNKNKLLNFYDLNDFKFILNSFFKSRKLTIIFASNNNLKKFIIEGGYHELTNSITILMNLIAIENLKKEPEMFEIFLKQFINFVIHEMIHREEFLKIKYDKIRKQLFTTKAGKSSEYSKDPSDKNKARKYLADKFELMSYAWQIINTFRMNGIEDKNISKILKTLNHDSIIKLKLGGKILEDYHNLFNDTKYSSTLRQLYKYMYEYINI